MSERIIKPNSGGFSRRDFLQTSSVAAGGALVGALSIDRSAYAAGTDKIKIALVGCGGRGSGAASQALETYNQGAIELVAMADAFKDRLESSLENLTKQAPDRVNVPPERRFVGFDAYKKAIAEADVVILATPPGFRSYQFEEAVNKGKHVFMEKPVATDAAGVRRVLAAAQVAKQKNLKVGVGLQRHHHSGYIETLKRLHDGEIGDIVAMHCYWNDGGVWVKPRQPGQTEMEYQMRNWYYFNWLCGDHINEQHIHNLDVINWVKNGYPVRAHGMGGRQVRTAIEYGEIFDHHAVVYEYADKSLCFSQCRHIRGALSSVSEHVIGTKGKADVSRNEIKGASTWRFKGEIKDPYQKEHDDFFNAIRNDLPYNEAENGAKSTMTAILGRMATYSGQSIEWDQAINSKIDIMPDSFNWDAKPKSLPDANGAYKIAIPGTTITV